MISCLLEEIASIKRIIINFQLKSLFWHFRDFSDFLACFGILALLEFFGNRQYTDQQRQSFLVCSNITKCLMHLNEYDNVAIGASRHHIISSTAYNPNQIFCFNSEKIASYRISMIIDREFNRHHHVNQLIKRIMESGLFAKWHSMHTRNWHDPSVDFGTPSVRVEQISGPISFALFIGWGLGSLTFIAEIIVGRRLRNENASRVWTYLEHFFDGKRRYFINLPERLSKSRK